MSDNKMNMKMMLTLLDKPIVFHRPFLLVMNTNAALFLSQCLYWQKNTKESFNGWFSRTIEQFTVETGLSRKEQDTAKKTLTEQGIIKTERRGLPAKLWIRIELGVLYSLINQAITETSEHRPPPEDETKRNTSMSKKDILELPKKTYIHIRDKEVLDKEVNKKKEKEAFINFSIFEIEELEDCDQIRITPEQYQKLKTKYGTGPLHKKIVLLDAELSENPNKYRNHAKRLKVWLENPTERDLNVESISSQGKGSKSLLTGAYDINAGKVKDTKTPNMKIIDDHIRKLTETRNMPLSFGDSLKKLLIDEYRETETEKLTECFKVVLAREYLTHDHRHRLPNFKEHQKEFEIIMRRAKPKNPVRKLSLTEAEKAEKDATFLRESLRINYIRENQIKPEDPKHAAIFDGLHDDEIKRWAEGRTESGQ